MQRTLLPIELLQRVAILLAPTDAPPADLISLLCTNKATHSVLSTTSNPHLYAEIFRRTFDTGALGRRFPGRALTAAKLCGELQRRWTVLKRIRDKSNAPPTKWGPRVYRRAIVLEDLMTAYLLFLESDGRNVRLLLSFADIEAYLGRYQQEIMLPLHGDASMPEELEETSLWCWLNWFTLDYHKCLTEEESTRSQMTWLLTPYVLGTFEYPHTYAPWQLPTLPLSSPSLQPSNSQAAPESPDDLPLVAPQSLITEPSTAIPGGYFDSDFRAPNLQQAATLLSLARVQDRPARDPALELVELPPTVPVNELLERARGQGVWPSVSSLRQHGDDEVFEGRKASFTPDYMRVTYATVMDSTQWDDEWLRLSTCTDATRPSGYKYQPGSMNGIWDSRNVILETHNYDRIVESLMSDPDERQEEVLNILEQEVASIQDTQSWSLTEYHGPALGDGDPLNAHLPVGGVEVVDWNASEFDPKTCELRKGVRVRVGTSSTLRFYSSTPSSTATHTLLLGEMAHSSLPSRLLEPYRTIAGVVRKWDGLVTLSVRARSRGRGDWVYSGYVVDGNFVGHWRDANTAVGYVAWEGVWVMRKRNPDQSIHL